MFDSGFDHLTADSRSSSARLYSNVAMAMQHQLYADLNVFESLLLMHSGEGYGVQL